MTRNRMNLLTIWSLCLTALLLLAACGEPRTDETSITTTAEPGEVTIPETEPALVSDVPAARPSDDVAATCRKEYRWDEWKQVPLVLQMDDDAKAAWQARTEEWNRKREEHQKSELGQKAKAANEEIRAAKDADKKEALREKHAKVLQQSHEQMLELRRFQLGALSPQQQKYWAAWVMYRGPWEGYSKKLDLSDAQKDKMWDIAQTSAAELVKADWLARDPYLTKDLARSQKTKTRELIEAHVLTREQKAKLEK
jgi:hypothetical protein